jgi:glycosyltransferase 2 family protein
VRSRLRAAAAPLLATFLFGAAIYLLVREAQETSWEEFMAGLTGVPPLYLACAALLVTLNYLLLMTYDLLALRYVRRSLPLRRVALIGFLGYALGNNLGAILAAIPLRFRFYRSWGLSASQVLAIIGFLGLTFWSGVCWLGGPVLIWVEIPLPPGVRLPIRTQTLGAILLGVGVLYALCCATWRRPLPIGGLQLRPPEPSLMALQTSVAALDLTVSATALYLILPAEAVVPFALVLAAYVVGIAVSLLSQIPGGLVVLELILMTLLRSSVGAAVMGSVLVFRLMYYVIPLILAALLLGWVEWRQRRQG